MICALPVVFGFYNHAFSQRPWILFLLDAPFLSPIQIQQCTYNTIESVSNIREMGSDILPGMEFALLSSKRRLLSLSRSVCNYLVSWVHWHNRCNQDKCIISETSLYYFNTTILLDFLIFCCIWGC